MHSVGFKHAPCREQRKSMTQMDANITARHANFLCCPSTYAQKHCWRPIRLSSVKESQLNPRERNVHKIERKGATGRQRMGARKPHPAKRGVSFTNCPSDPQKLAGNASRGEKGIPAEGVIPGVFLSLPREGKIYARILDLFSPQSRRREPPNLERRERMGCLGT